MNFRPFCLTLAFALAAILLAEPALSAQQSKPANAIVKSVSATSAVDQNVPHGVLHHHTYTTHVASGLPNDQDEYIVYTPPGYTPKSGTSYPVLYLLHGWSQGASAWSQVGRANLVLDALIAASKARPMIVVMPTGYGDQTFLTNGFGVWNDEAAVDRNTRLFTQALLTEVIPQVEQQYDVARDRDDRAIAGLSMGGLESIDIGLNHLEQFAWIGGFSAAVQGIRTVDELPAITSANAPHLLWIACGTGDRLVAANRNLESLLEKHGLNVTAIETPGEHVWAVWQDNFVHFAPLLFQK